MRDRNRECSKEIGGWHCDGWNVRGEKLDGCEEFGGWHDGGWNVRNEELDGWRPLGEMERDEEFLGGNREQFERVNHERSSRWKLDGQWPLCGDLELDDHQGLRCQGASRTTGARTVASSLRASRRPASATPGSAPSPGCSNAWSSDPRVGSEATSGPPQAVATVDRNSRKPTRRLVTAKVALAHLAKMWEEQCVQEKQARCIPKNARSTELKWIPVRRNDSTRSMHGERAAAEAHEDVEETQLLQELQAQRRKY